MTAVGFYLTTISLLIPIISYISIKSYQYLIHNYDIQRVQPPSRLLNEKMAGHYDERRKDISISYPQISHFLDNDFYQILNREIEESVLSYLDENLYEYSFSYSVGLKGERILSIKMEQYYYYYPALNGNGSTFAINIDPMGSRVIDFFDLFDARRNALKEIKDMVRNGFDQNCGVFEEKYESNSYVPSLLVREVLSSCSVNMKSLQEFVVALVL